MKLELLQENLAKSLSVVSRIISSRPQIPILSHVLLTIDGNSFTLTASNTETTIVVPVGAKIESPGSFTLPARTFQDLVASLPAGKISLETVEGQMKIKAVSFTGKINGTAAQEYPSLTPQYADKPFWEIDPEILSTAISKTLFSCATDESRALLTGVLFKPGKSSLTLAATDGFRLSRYDISNITLPETTTDSVVIPAKTLSEVSKLLSEQSNKTKVKIFFLDNSQVLFLLGEVKIYSRLISGSFPDFEKIIPSSSEIKIVMTSEELSKAVKVSSIFARESANIIKLKLESKTLKVSANAAQVGEDESDTDIEVEKGSTDDFQIAFNYRYILDFLGSLGKDTKISIDFTTPLAPGVLRPVSDKNFLHLIMPVRVQS